MRENKIGVLILYVFGLGTGEWLYDLKTGSLKSSLTTQGAPDQAGPIAK